MHKNDLKVDYTHTLVRALTCIYICTYYCTCQCITVVDVHALSLPQATVLEEMPVFPDRESSLLSKLYQSAPWTAKLHKTSGEESVGGATQDEVTPTVPVADVGQPVGETPAVTSTGKGVQCACACMCTLVWVHCYGHTCVHESNTLHVSTVETGC